MLCMYLFPARTFFFFYYLNSILFTVVLFCLPLILHYIHIYIYIFVFFFIPLIFVFKLTLYCHKYKHINDNIEYHILFCKYILKARFDFKVHIFYFIYSLFSFSTIFIYLFFKIMIRNRCWCVV